MIINGSGLATVSSEGVLRKCVIGLLWLHECSAAFRWVDRWIECLFASCNTPLFGQCCIQLFALPSLPPSLPLLVVVAGRRGHPLDPVVWWCLYVALVPAPQEAAAFGYTSEGVYVPLVHTEFVSWVKRLLSRAGFDSSKYAGHSFRRGAATFSFLVGLPDLLVKEMGAWRSQVYQVYMDLSLSQKLSVHSTWFDAMAAGQLGGELVPPS